MVIMKSTMNLQVGTDLLRKANNYPPTLLPATIAGNVKANRQLW